MNNRAVTLSLLMAVLAVFFVQSYVSSIEESTQKKFGTEVLVVTAKKRIGEMDTINETMLELKPIPQRFLEPAAIYYQASDDETAVVKDMKKIAGSIAMVPIQEGEQLTYNKLTEPGLRTGLSPQVAPGRRAVALPVNEYTGVGKLVKPGDRVDVIVTLALGGSQNNRVTKTVLQDVVVLAVGRNVTNNAARIVERGRGKNSEVVRPLTQYDGFTSVTVEVEPMQAQMLAHILAGRQNEITLALRNNDDTDRVSTGEVTLRDVMEAAGSRVPSGRSGGSR